MKLTQWIARIKWWDAAVWGIIIAIAVFVIIFVKP